MQAARGRGSQDEAGADAAVHMQGAIGTQPRVPPVASAASSGAPAWADPASATGVATLIRQSDVTQLDQIVRAIEDAARAQRDTSSQARVPLRIDGVFNSEVSPRDLEPLHRLALASRATAPAPMSVAPAVAPAAAPPTAAPAAAPPTADGHVDYLDRALIVTALGRVGVSLPFALTPTLTSAQIQQLVARITSGTPSLADYGPRIALLHILQNLGEGPVSALADRLARLPSLTVMRPDGYMVRASDGRAIERFGGGNGQVRDGQMMFDQFAAGGIYVNNSNMYYRAGPTLQRASGPIGEGGLEHDLPNRVLDGAEAALGSMAHGIAQLIREPIRSIAGLANLPSAATALLRASPELWERFRTLPVGDQVQMISRVASELLLLYGTAEGATTRITETMGQVHEGMQAMRALTTLRLSPAGAIVREVVAVRPGALATAIGGGPGAVYVLHMSNQGLPGDGAGSSGTGSGTGEPAATGEPPVAAEPAAPAGGRQLPPPPEGAAPPDNLASIMSDAPAGARAVYPAELGSASGEFTLMRAWMRLESNGALRVHISNFQGRIDPFAAIGNLRVLARNMGASALQIDGDLFVALEASGEPTRIQRLVAGLERRGYIVERVGEHTRLIIPSL